MRHLRCAFAMNLHTLLALIQFLHDEIKRLHSDAPSEACWPTTADMNENILFNARFFPGGNTALTTYRRIMMARGLIEIGPCVDWHRCEHWRLTELGQTELERMTREGCGRGKSARACSHAPLTRHFKRAA